MKPIFHVHEEIRKVTSVVIAFALMFCALPVLSSEAGAPSYSSSGYDESSIPTKKYVPTAESSPQPLRQPPLTPATAVTKPAVQPQQTVNTSTSTAQQKTLIPAQIPTVVKPASPSTGTKAGQVSSQPNAASLGATTAANTPSTSAASSNSPAAPTPTVAAGAVPTAASGTGTGSLNVPPVAPSTANPGGVGAAAPPAGPAAPGVVGQPIAPGGQIGADLTLPYTPDVTVSVTKLQNLKSIIDTVIANFETMLANRADKMTAFENVEESVLDLLTKIQAAQPIQSPPDPVIPAARQITPGKVTALTNAISDSKDQMSHALAQLRMKLANIKMLASTVDGLIREADRISKTGYETKAEADEVARVFNANINTQISALQTALNQQRSQFNQQLTIFNLAYNTARSRIGSFLSDVYYIIQACQRAGRISGIPGRQDVVDQYWKTRADYNALPR
jgi:hypothetical protein